MDAEFAFKGEISMVEKIIGKRGYENDKKLHPTAPTCQIGENITHIFVCRPNQFDYQTDELIKQTSSKTHV